MDRPSQFRMETAGSLTPELEGAPHSGVHRNRTKEKGREITHETRQKTLETNLSHPQQTR